MAEATQLLGGGIGFAQRAAPGQRPLGGLELGDPRSRVTGCAERGPEQRPGARGQHADSRPPSANAIASRASAPRAVGARPRRAAPSPWRRSAAAVRWGRAVARARDCAVAAEPRRRLELAERELRADQQLPAVRAAEIEQPLGRPGLERGQLALGRRPRRRRPQRSREMQPREAGEVRLRQTRSSAPPPRERSRAPARCPRRRSTPSRPPTAPTRELVVAGQHRGVGRGLGDCRRLGDPALHQQRVRLEHEQAGDQRALAGQLREAQPAPRASSASSICSSADAACAMYPPTSMCSASCSSDSAAYAACASASSERASAGRLSEVLARLQSAPPSRRISALRVSARARCPAPAMRPRASAGTPRASNDRAPARASGRGRPRCRAAATPASRATSVARLERVTAHPLWRTRSSPRASPAHRRRSGPSSPSASSRSRAPRRRRRRQRRARGLDEQRQPPLLVAVEPEAAGWRRVSHRPAASGARAAASRPAWTSSAIASSSPGVAELSTWCARTLAGAWAACKRLRHARAWAPIRQPPEYRRTRLGARSDGGSGSVAARRSAG